MMTWLYDHKREAVLLALLFLASTISFAAGYLFARDAQTTPIIIQQQ